MQVHVSLNAGRVYVHPGRSVVSHRPWDRASLQCAVTRVACDRFAVGGKWATKGLGTGRSTMVGGVGGRLPLALLPRQLQTELRSRSLCRATILLVSRLMI